MLHLNVTVQHIQPQIIPITDFQDKKTQHIQSLQIMNMTSLVSYMDKTVINIFQCLTWGTQKL